MSSPTAPCVADIRWALAALSNDEARQRIRDFHDRTLYQYESLPHNAGGWAFRQGLAPSRENEPQGNSALVYRYLEIGHLRLAAGLAADCRRVVRLAKAFAEAKSDVNEDPAAHAEWREFARLTRLESLEMLLKALA